MLDQFVRAIAEKIRERFRPQKVILFGSTATGNASDESDIDLLVIMETQLPPFRQASLIRQYLDDSFGVSRAIDIIVRTPEVVEQRIKEGDFFLKTATERGIAL
ncbi:MAG: hypothetical protein A2Z34_05985 [Planctomycetes bacterium RBG_16_59_8]|nr:MAG: hypothetical protein A2Z34_05985 [Planctomycetes bacterium RBG_16_59_8]